MGGASVARVATILLVGVDLFFRGKLDGLLQEHRLVTSDSVDAPDLVIADIARVEPEEVVDAWPDIPILGYTNHTDKAGLQRAHAAGFDQVIVKSALVERAAEIVDGARRIGRGRHPLSATDGVATLAPVTYIIAEPCIDIKDRSCVDVCPVDCIHEFERILIIDPEECIDCGACEPECPVEAIFPEDALPDKWNAFVEINYAFPDPGKINSLVDTYATEHNVQNEPLE